MHEYKETKAIGTTKLFTNVLYNRVILTGKPNIYFEKSIQIAKYGAIIKNQIILNNMQVHNICSFS